MRIFPIRDGETWEVWDGPHRLAVIKFSDGRIVCVSHDDQCRHAQAVRAHTRVN